MFSIIELLIKQKRNKLRQDRLSLLNTMSNFADAYQAPEELQNIYEKDLKENQCPICGGVLFETTDYTDDGVFCGEIMCDDCDYKVSNEEE